MAALEDLCGAIGQTPLIRLAALSEQVGAHVYLKYEAANPGASIKDRAALSMIDGAERAGRIVRGQSVLVEPTSGNTGIGIAMIGAARGYKVVLAMPESMSRERRALAAAYGARVVLTPAAEGMRGAVEEARRIERDTPGAWIVGQFDNPDNPRAHEEHTAPGIEAQLSTAPEVVVAGVGTGGTISGCAHYFKRNGAVPRCYAVEPAESPLISQALAGAPLTPAAHGIQGIGANFIPATLDLDALAGAVSVSTEAALAASRACARETGLLVGISTGANLAAVQGLVAANPDLHGARIVTFGVDTGERYLSTVLFEGMA